MIRKDFVFGVLALIFLSLLCIGGYQLIKKKENDSTEEYAAILNTLNEETHAFFTRDYQLWSDKWIHKPYVSKTYMIMTDSSVSETLGWAAIRNFGKTYLEAHPDPEPAPDPLQEIEVRLYGQGAWVSFEQHDPTRGLKRETRLLEKVDGEWKIAGMHTTIYGFKK